MCRFSVVINLQRRLQVKKLQWQERKGSMCRLREFEYIFF